MNESSPVLTRRDGAVLILSNNNPAARNALTAGDEEAMTVAMREAATDPTVGAVVLAGEGGYFSSVGDLRRLAKSRALTQAQGRLRREGLQT